jgi:hypothetical protein
MLATKVPNANRVMRMYMFQSEFLGKPIGHFGASQGICNQKLTEANATQQT